MLYFPHSLILDIDSCPSCGSTHVGQNLVKVKENLFNYLCFNGVIGVEVYFTLHAKPFTFPAGE